MKNYVCTLCGMLGSLIAGTFGSWNAGLTTLIVFMAIDYISGIVVAAVFKRSPKSETGSLKSLAGWKGLCRKGMTLLIVMVAYRLDLMIGVDYIRDTAVIGFAVNELISITENAGLMGVPLPKVIKKAIDVLNERSEDNENKGN